MKHEKHQNYNNKRKFIIYGSLAIVTVLIIVYFYNNHFLIFFNLKKKVLLKNPNSNKISPIISHLKIFNLKKSTYLLILGGVSAIYLVTIGLTPSEVKDIKKEAKDHIFYPKVQTPAETLIIGILDEMILTVFGFFLIGSAVLLSDS